MVMEDQRGDTDDDRFTLIKKGRPQLGHADWKSPMAPNSIVIRGDKTFRSKGAKWGVYQPAGKRYD